MKCLAGKVYDGEGFRDGYALVEGGKTVEIGEGKAPYVPDAVGVVIPRMVDGHTHCADAGVKVEPGMTLEELVAPPDGLKHRYLREVSEDTLVHDMHEFEETARSNGIGTIVDFREDGMKGCILAGKALSDAVVLGRPVSPSFDGREVEDILSVADGIALPSVSDMDRRYTEKVAQACHAAGKPFALHVSERIREDMEFVMSLEPAFVVHMVEATDADILACADAGIPIVICPRSNRFFGKTARAARMLELGAEVALGTDNAMLCPPDMRGEARMLAGILSAQGGDPSDVWHCLIDGGGKLLNRTKSISSAFGTSDPAVVLPCPGKSPDTALDSEGPVFVP